MSIGPKTNIWYHMLKSSQITKVGRRRPKSTDARIVLKSDTESRILKSVEKSSCQSYNDTCPFFCQYDLWVSVTLIVNGVSPNISHTTKYTGLRQFEKCYGVIYPMFLFNCPNFDLWYLHFYKNGHVSL